MKLIIVGGGASGLVAAIAAARTARKDTDVLLLEGGAKPGRKILSTGNGHCNMTNEKALPMAYYSDNTVVLDDLMARFSYRDVLDFFNELGIPSVSRDGYYYPKNREASSIRDALVSEVERLGVRVFNNTKIVKAEKNRDCFVLTAEDGHEYRGDRVILACGGMAYPKSGSDGSGYNLAMDLGHNIVQPLPGLVALTAEENWVKNFAGVRLDGTVTLQVDGIRRRSQQGEIQLTDYGISGIPVFQLSGDAVDALSQNKKTAILLNFWDNKTETDILFALKMRCKARPDWETGELLRGIVPNKCIATLLNLSKIELHVPCKTISVSSLTKLAKNLSQLTFTINGAKDFESAQITRGGVSLEDVDRNLQSKLTPGLYFAGEILNVDGPCGGYNLQWAWTSGHEAGLAAVK